MIYLEAGAEVPNNQYLVKETGTYEEAELVPCYKAGDPEKAVIVQFQATYISTGENI